MIDNKTLLLEIVASKKSGKINSNLGIMIVVIVDHHLRADRFINPEWFDAIYARSLDQLNRVGLKFDETRSQNPYAFFIQVIKGCAGYIRNYRMLYWQVIYGLTFEEYWHYIRGLNQQNRP